ncbi:MAG: alkaline phosphatase family protein [Candidatus Dormiibacterota bacterium]
MLVIMEENKGYKATLGSCGADPYWCSLAAKYASDTSWFGVAHPSEPNYVAFESGGIQGCVGDTSCAANSVSATDLGGQLTAKGVPWVGWMESMPSPCYTGVASSGYFLKHSFGGFFKDEYGACHILPYPGVSSAVNTLDGASAPDFVWITPNVTNDMHDGSVQQGDAWLKANLAPILASTWFTGFNSTVVVTMDENDAQSSPAGGQVPMVIISSLAAGRGAIATPGNHYGLLRSIEEVYRLPLLGAAALPVNGDVRSLFG